MSKTVVLIPIHTEYSHPSYHLKSEHSDIDFSEFNEDRNYRIVEKPTKDDNYYKIFLVTQHTISLDESDYFCKFDVISPFESNKSKDNFTKEDLTKALNFHINDVKNYVEGKEIEFPDNKKYELKFRPYDIEKISDKFVSDRK